MVEKLAGLAGGFYDRVANLGRWFSGRLRLDRIPPWVEEHLRKPALLVAIELAVAVSLAVYFFFLMLPQAEMPRPQDTSLSNVYLFTNLSHHRAPIKEDYAAEFPAWGPRVASQALTGAFWDAAIYLSGDDFTKSSGWKVTWNGYDFGLMLVSFAAYQTIWLALLFFLLIWHRPDALVIILGTFAGLTYNLTVPSGEWFYPWDLPALCLFTWMVLVYDQGKYGRLLLAVWLAGLVKETGMVGGLLVLLGPWPWRKRILGFSGLLAAFLVCRELLLKAWEIHTVFLPFNNATSSVSFFTAGFGVLESNIVNLFSFHLNSVWFANCGLLFLVLFLPGNSFRHTLFKFMALAFICGQFLFGYAHEFREWYELLPLGWILVCETIAGCFQNQSPGRVVWQPFRGTVPPDSLENANTRLLKGGYWFVATGALAAAVMMLILSWTGIIPTATGAGKPATGGADLTDPLTQNAAVMNNLAWQLSTSPESGLRDGTLAVELAERACKQTSYQQPVLIGTLAAAYAEAGRFDDAISAGKKACAVATGLGDTNLVKRNQELLVLYQAHQPCRDVPSSAASPP